MSCVDDVVCRVATLADADVIASFNVAMAQETEGRDLNPATAQAGCSAVLEDPTLGWYYVAILGEAIVATLMINFEWSDWSSKRMWWVQSVYVAPPHRRRGLFTRLYQHARAEALKAGAGGLKLYTVHGNKKAHATYEALGMECHHLVYEDIFS